MPRRKKITRDAKDAVTGDIFWLSPRPGGGEGSQTNRGVRDIFDHPVLVLSIHTDENIACVLILSSLNGKNIEQYSNNAPTRALHLPIYPAPAHPDSGKILCLDNGLRLQKDTNVKLKTRYLLPFHLINFSYCDHRTRQKYSLQPVSFDIVRTAVDSGRPAVYPTGIGDLPSPISGSKKSIPSAPDFISPTYTPRRPLVESSHNVRPVTYSTILSKATNIESSHSVRPVPHGFHLPKATNIESSHSVRPVPHGFHLPKATNIESSHSVHPVPHGFHLPKATNFESSYNVRPATYGTYLPKTTDFYKGNLLQEQSFRTPLLADVSQQHTRWHYNTDLERQGPHQSTSSSHAVDSTRSRRPSCCTLMLYALGFLLFLLFMAYLGVGAKA